MKNNKGFTVVEMLIVLAIISVLLVLIIPNLNQKRTIINNKGCEALKETVNTQIYLYELEKNRLPSSISELVSAGYLSQAQTSCKNNKRIVVSNGQAVIQ